MLVKVDLVEKNLTVNATSGGGKFTSRGRNKSTPHNRMGKEFSGHEIHFTIPITSASSQWANKVSCTKDCSAISEWSSNCPGS